MPALYRDPLVDKEGVWGIPTSTLDWCEENYAVTKFVAEFWNTITNYFMVVPPLFTALRCHQLGLDTRFTLSFLSFMGIGIGSTLFHATLLYKMQLLDELPMIYCTYIMLYCVLACDNVPPKKDFVLKLFLCVFSILVTVVYIVFVNPLVFQWVYGLSVAVLIVSSAYSARKHNVSQRFSVLALICYGTGFVLWNIDNVFCARVRYFRDMLPWPFDALGQLHGWWHCFAAFGGYFQILYTIDLRATCIKYKRKCKQNGSHQNGGTHIQSLSKKNFSSSIFRDIWCWIPRRKLYDPEYGVNNNVIHNNGNCKTCDWNSC